MVMTSASVFPRGSSLERTSAEDVCRHPPHRKRRRRHSTTENAGHLRRPAGGNSQNRRSAHRARFWLEHRDVRGIGVECVAGSLCAAGTLRVEGINRANKKCHRKRNFQRPGGCHTEPAEDSLRTSNAFTIALVGNPNAGKTTLFNALTGLRAKTANFPGTTIERKVGRAQVGCHQAVIVVDLPGLYSLDSSAPEEKIASDALRGKLSGHDAPDAVLIVVDATNLERNLFLASQVLEFNRPVIIALNMTDMAESEGIRIDVKKLRTELGCAVVPISARNRKRR